MVGAQSFTGKVETTRDSIKEYLEGYEMLKFYKFEF